LLYQVGFPQPLWKSEVRPVPRGEPLRIVGAEFSIGWMDVPLVLVTEPTGGVKAMRFSTSRYRLRAIRVTAGLLRFNRFTRPAENWRRP